jgi:hypothetical protein
MKVPRRCFSSVIKGDFQVWGKVAYEMLRRNLGNAEIWRFANMKNVVSDPSPSSAALA